MSVEPIEPFQAKRRNACDRALKLTCPSMWLLEFRRWPNDPRIILSQLG